MPRASATLKALQSVGIRLQPTAIAEQIADTRKVRLAEAGVVEVMLGYSESNFS